MINYKKWLSIALGMALSMPAWAGLNPTPRISQAATNQQASAPNASCAAASAQIDLSVNSVRARLRNGGDIWWDGFGRGGYIVPASNPQQVASLAGSGLWLGGIDPAGNLKLACMTPGNITKSDFWPGPLNAMGETTPTACKDWNRMFRVSSDEIREHLRNLEQGKTNPSLIPKGVKGWPAVGNPFFREVNAFSLPSGVQGLAGFFDANNDGVYNPLDGDYPAIEVKGCPSDRFADEMVFWIFNDEGAGAVHENTGSGAMKVEVQAQAFAFQSNDELNETTFYRYKIISRASEQYDSTFFALWVDPALGCPGDDYIGCDPRQNLMYAYNADAIDGDVHSSCFDGRPTYGSSPPLVGVNLLRGPNAMRHKHSPDSDSVKIEEFQLGMTGFMYYHKGNFMVHPGMMAPTLDIEYYRYLSGHWRDGTALKFGGAGYGPGVKTKFAFPGMPSDPDGWSMCNESLAASNRVTLQISGPFTLLPGSVNEMIWGVPWTPQADYPCPDLEPLFRASRLLRLAFETCWSLEERALVGPDAPDVNWIESHQELIGVLSNDSPLSNNYREQYRAPDPLAPDRIAFDPDPAVRAQADYVFEGYVVYQLANPNVKPHEYDDPAKARITTQFDTQNGVSKLYNWEPEYDPLTGDRIYAPVLQVDGADKGIRRTFSVTEDRFAQGNDRRLINHRPYYFSVVAYAYNNYEPFDALKRPVSGQLRTCQFGKRNVQVYTVIPRPVVDVSLETAFGEQLAITRLQGRGAGGYFLDLDQETRNAILTLPPGQDTLLAYQPGRGPLAVTIFNPFEVKDGEYEIALVDDNLNDNVLAPDARWVLRRLDSPDDPVLSDRSIARLNEQIVAQYGFTVSVLQTPNSGELANPRNGGIGAEVEYANPQFNWLSGIADTDLGMFNFVRTNLGEIDRDLDPNQGLSTLGNGWFVPYALADWRIPTGPNVGDERLITPAWNETTNNLNRAAIGADAQRAEKLVRLRNVDIVLTPDTSKWSRCIVVETASVYYTAPSFPKIPGLQPQSPTPTTTANVRKSMDTRWALSVGKRDLDGDGLPDPDGATDPNGQPVYGMGWFPGYAIDVETGQRLNVFFGENSAWHSDLGPSLPPFTGRDMLLNPTADLVTGLPPLTPFGFGEYYNYPLGGQHFVYVTHTPYDQCAALRSRLAPELQPNPNNSTARKVARIGDIEWCGMLALAPGYSMLPLNRGLIPTETRIKLRVDKSFAPWFAAGVPQPTVHPKYRFRIAGKERRDLDATQANNALDSIRVVPNPYYAYSAYETEAGSGAVKITNLPGRCTVTIYDLGGRFIRSFARNESYEPYRQISPALVWDLRNHAGREVASGVYLIHISAPDIGERTIKWFGVMRRMD